MKCFLHLSEKLLTEKKSDMYPVRTRKKDWRKMLRRW